MKKILKKEVIIAFIIGILISGGIVYAAVSASQIGYTTDKNTNITNIEQALNDLYLKNNYEYFEFDHKENTQYDYDFGFVPSKFLAILQNYDGYKVIISYNTFNNSLYAAFAEASGAGTNLTSSFYVDSTKLKSNLPTNWYLYTKTYKIYIYASK